MSEVKDNQTDKINKKDKIKDNEKNKRKQIENKHKSTTTCMNQKRLQLCAWVLLTVGLCIVVTTFYLAIQQNSSTNDVVAVAGGKLIDDSNDLAEIKDDAIVGSGTGTFSVDDEEPSYNRSGRHKISDYLYEVIGKNVSGCQEKSCQISCTNVVNVYVALHDIIKTTSCPSIDVLLLDKQEFPLGVLKNYWLPSNMSFYEVIIRFSNITKIKSNAFNAPLFKDTFVLSLSHMHIDKVESGALLGLYRLKYLTIKSHIRKYEPSIFQPVQTTLVNLKLNANLKINGNKNLFGVSYMNNLIYLDLSSNIFKGSLGKKFFKSTPNLKYLIIIESQIQHIEEDAFENLAGKLVFVNLSKNLLTTLAAAVLRPILITQHISMLNLANNDWICNCQLQELAELYKEYRLQFMDVLYCKGPHHLYGMSLEEIDFKEESCIVSSTTVQDTMEEKEFETVTHPEISTIKTTTTSKSYNGGSGAENSSDFMTPNEVSSTEPSNTLKMRCFDSSSYSHSSSSLEIDEKRSIDGAESSVELMNDDLDYLQFPPPTYDFELLLIPENNSVIVSIDNPADVLVIWFSDQLESTVITYGETSLDYECMQYALPELIVGPLQENTTYTFCLLPPLRNDISPFNCLPLYVPPKRRENIWISEDNKQFTIGMLCLIFLLSTIAGALIAYFGIKTYPDLLEGSKNVLVVKKPDQACYVATISETEYQKQASMKKKKLTNTETPLKKQPSIKLPLPDTPPMEASPLAYRMSVKDLERLSSLKSSSTCFEDTFPAYNFVDDEYETPKVCNDEYTIEQRSVPNAYGMSPRSPPPLPKRNSNVSNSPTLVINRFSSNFD